jgi:hypothetical protein
VSKPNESEEPVLSGRHRKKTLNRVPVFLEAYRTTASVASAARIAGLRRESHYDRLANDPAYQKAFARAKEELSDTIEGELFRRAIRGEKEPVFYRGKKVATVTRRSDSLLMFIAKGAMPNKYRENVTTEHTGSIEIIERLQSARKRLFEMRAKEDAAAGG